MLEVAGLSNSKTTVSDVVSDSLPQTWVDSAQSMWTTDHTLSEAVVFSFDNPLYNGLPSIGNALPHTPPAPGPQNEHTPSYIALLEFDFPIVTDSHRDSEYIERMFAELVQHDVPSLNIDQWPSDDHNKVSLSRVL